MPLLPLALQHMSTHALPGRFARRRAAQRSRTSARASRRRGLPGDEVLWKQPPPTFTSEQRRVLAGRWCARLQDPLGPALRLAVQAWLEVAQGGCWGGQHPQSCSPIHSRHKRVGMPAQLQGACLLNFPENGHSLASPRSSRICSSSAA